MKSDFILKINKTPLQVFSKNRLKISCDEFCKSYFLKLMFEECFIRIELYVSSSLNKSYRSYIFGYIYALNKFHFIEYT